MEIQLILLIVFVLFTEDEYYELMRKLRFLAKERSNEYLEQRHLKQKHVKPSKYLYWATKINTIYNGKCRI